MVWKSKFEVWAFELLQKGFLSILACLTCLNYIHSVSKSLGLEGVLKLCWPNLVHCHDLLLTAGGAALAWALSDTIGGYSHYLSSLAWEYYIFTFDYNFPGDGPKILLLLPASLKVSKINMIWKTKIENRKSKFEIRTSSKRLWTPLWSPSSPTIWMKRGVAAVS